MSTEARLVQPDVVPAAAYATPLCRMLIGGELVQSSDGQYDDSINPATEQVIGRTPAATARDVDKAVTAAEAAWPAWAALSPYTRAEILRGFGQAIARRADEILRVEVADTGNSATAMRGDVQVAIESLNYYGGISHELKGESIPAATNWRGCPAAPAKN